MLRYFMILLIFSWPLSGHAAPKNLWADYYRSKFETDLSATNDAATLARKYFELHENDKKAFKEFYSKVYSKLDNGKIRADVLDFACGNDKVNCLSYVHESAKLTETRDRTDKLLVELYLDNYNRNKELFSTAFSDLYAAINEPAQRNEILESACRIDKQNCADFFRTAMSQKKSNDDNNKLFLSLFNGLINTNISGARLLFEQVFFSVTNFEIRTELLTSACSKDRDFSSDYFNVALSDSNYMNNQFDSAYDIFKTFLKQNNNYYSQKFSTIYKLTVKPKSREQLLEYSCDNDRHNCANYLRVALENRSQNQNIDNFIFETYQKILTINPQAYKELFSDVFTSLSNEKIKTELLNYSCSRDIRNCSHYLASALNDALYAERQGSNILSQFKKTIKSDPGYYKDNYLSLYQSTKNVNYRQDLLEYSCNNNASNCWYYLDIALTNNTNAPHNEKEILKVFKSLINSNPNLYRDKYKEVFTYFHKRDSREDLFEFSCEKDRKNASIYLAIAISDKEFLKHSNDALVKQLKSFGRLNIDYYRNNYIEVYTSIKNNGDRLDFAEYSCNIDKKNCVNYYNSAIENEFYAKNSLEYFSYLVRNSNNTTVLSAAKTIFNKCREIDSKSLYDFYEKVVVLSGHTDETAVAIVTKGIRQDDVIALKFLDVVKKYPSIYANNEEVYASIANLVVKTGNAKLKQAAIAVHEQWRMSRQQAVAAQATPVNSSPSQNLSTPTAEPAKVDFKIVKTGVNNRNGIAVIIGNRNYASKGKNIPNVDYAHNDAELMKRYVVETLGYDPANIIFVKDATQADMISIFGSPGDHRGKLNNWVKSGVSDILVFYSGHGAPSLKDGKGYIVPVDADPMTIELNGYKLDQFYENLAKIDAREKTVIIDACFSGASQSGSVITNASSIALREKVEPSKRLDNTSIFTASGPDEIASWDTKSRTGLLTGNFLRGLSGEADGESYGNNDGQITVGELRKYLESEVSYAARRNYGRDQHPQVFSNEDTVLLRYR